MKFNKNLKSILSLLFIVVFCLNIVMYFYIVNSVNVFGREINVLYIQLAFILIEMFMLSGIYGKKQGLAVCLLYVLLIAGNIWFIIANLV